MSRDDKRLSMDDVLPGRLLARVGAAFVAAILVGAAISTAMARSTPPTAGNAGKAPSAIGMVEQTPVEVQERGLAVARAERAALERYSWIDRDAGVAQIPLDVALARTVLAYAPAGSSRVGTASPDGGAL